MLRRSSEQVLEEASTETWTDWLTMSGWLTIGIGAVLAFLAWDAMRERDMASFITVVAKEAKLLARIAKGNGASAETVGTNLVLPNRFPRQRWAWIGRLKRRFLRNPKEWFRVRHFRMVMVSCEEDGSADVEPLWDSGLSRRDVINRALAMYPLGKRYYTAEEMPDKVPGYPGSRQPATIVEMATDDGVHAYLFVEGQWWWQRTRHDAVASDEATDDAHDDEVRALPTVKYGLDQECS